MGDLDLLTLARRKPIHFMGIGGAGMLPLAELVLRAGGQVTGCDSALGAGGRAMRARGVTVHEGHDPAHVAGCGALVVTSAVEADHPEIAAATVAAAMEPAEPRLWLTKRAAVIRRACRLRTACVIIIQCGRQRDVHILVKICILLMGLPRTMRCLMLT